MGNFKNVFKQLRLSAGLTQDELSNALNLSKSTISMYENGNREPDFETLECIADYFNVDMNTLIGYKNQPPTIAAHFNGDEYTEEELDKIKEFAAFVKSTRKNEDKRAAQKAAIPAPAADAPIAFPDHLTVNAAHAIDGATQEEKQHDDDIMDNDDEWK